MTHEQIREKLRMVASLASAATTFHEEAMMKNLASIRETLAGIGAPADLCGGEVVAWQVTWRSLHGSGGGSKIVLTEPDPKDWLTVNPLYAKPQQPAAEDECAHEAWEQRHGYRTCCDCKAFLDDTAALSSRSATPEHITAEQLGEIMQDEWSDFCEDAQAHPDDIRRDGRKLFYDPRQWTRRIADRLNQRSAAMPTPAAIRAETTAQVEPMVVYSGRKATAAIVEFLRKLAAEASDACDCNPSDPLMTASAYLHGAANDVEAGDHLTGGGE